MIRLFEYRFLLWCRTSPFIHIWSRCQSLLFDLLITSVWVWERTIVQPSRVRRVGGRNSRSFAAKQSWRHCSFICAHGTKVCKSAVKSNVKDVPGCLNGERWTTSEQLAAVWGGVNFNYQEWRGPLARSGGQPSRLMCVLSKLEYVSENCQFISWFWLKYQKSWLVLSE